MVWAARDDRLERGFRVVIFTVSASMFPGESFDFIWLAWICGVGGSGRTDA
jgi:hypothetical protein